jgi:hypothetical protein
MAFFPAPQARGWAISSFEVFDLKPTSILIVKTVSVLFP